MEKTNKHKKVLEHLKEHGKITSWEAIELYGATRLSAIIFNLRKKHLIDTVEKTTVDRYGNTCNFAEYTYIRPLGENEYKQSVIDKIRGEENES